MDYKSSSGTIAIDLIFKVYTLKIRHQLNTFTSIVRILLV
ncbi:unnamed protein product, partial [Litomosoides sigmodontis]